ncbi:MAG: hypothetical protein NC191_03245 [Muribaculaceae bacterium]|nr:hypothetical protein [Muribaculaceae bacterium]
MKVDMTPAVKAAKKLKKRNIPKEKIAKVIQREKTRELDKLYVRSILERHAENMDPEDYIKARAYLASVENNYYAGSNFIL